MLRGSGGTRVCEHGYTCSGEDTNSTRVIGSHMSRTLLPPAPVQYVVCGQSGRLYATGLLRGPLQAQAEPAPGLTVQLSQCSEQQGKPCAVGTTK